MTNQTIYFDVISHRNWMTWLWSGLTAMGLNMILYLLMPHLMDTTPCRPSIDTLVPHVNVIRIQQPETPIKPKEVKPPPPPVVKRAENRPQQPMQAKLTLPFEINPRLPGGSNTLTLPPLESAPMVSTDLSNVFSAGQLDTPLTTLVRIAPVYPMRARRRGIEGWVRVSFLVDETGNVHDVSVIAAEPPGIFDQNARRCVSGWRFKPGTIEGTPVRTKAETTIRYTLE